MTRNPVFYFGVTAALMAALVFVPPAFAQQSRSTTPPPPPKPHAEEADNDSSQDRDARDRNRDDENRSSRDASSRETSRSSREGSARDASRSSRDGSSRDTSDSSRERSARDSDRSSRDTARDQDRSARDSRSYSRDVGERSRDRDDEADEDRSSSRDRSSRDQDDEDEDRSSSRDRSSRDEESDRSESRDRDDRSTSRDQLREDVRDTARGVRNTVRDARDTARDTVRDARGAARDVRDTVSRSSRTSRQEFDVNTARAADVGLWFNRSTNNGLVINDVANSGPIARLGFREGDRIVSVDGYRVNSERQFISDLFADDLRNQRVSVVVNRNGTQRTIYVEPAILIEHYSAVENDPLEQFGIVLDDRYQDRLVVWKVILRSPAYYAGVRTGDVITAWNGQQVRSKEQLVEDLQSANEGDEIRLTVYRGQQPRQLEAEIPRLASRSESRTVYRPDLDSGRRTYDSGTYEAYPSTEITPRAPAPVRPVLPRPGILPRNR